MHYFPSSKLPYRFSKVVSFWTFLLIQLGLELRLGVGVGVGFELAISLVYRVVKTSHKVLYFLHICTFYFIVNE